MPSFSQQTSTCYKGTLKSTKKIGKSLLEYLALQSLPLRLKFRRPWCPRQRYIFHRTTNLAGVSPLSTGQLFFSVEVVLSIAPQISRRKHISEHIFYRTPFFTFFTFSGVLYNTPVKLLNIYFLLQYIST